MWLIVAVSLVIFVIVFYFVRKSKNIKTKDDFSVYKAKDFLLSRTEKNVYDDLVNILGNRKNLMVLPKIKLTDFIWTPKENPNAYLRIQSKFVDFLIVDLPYLKPKFAVFLVNPDNRIKMQSLNIIEPVLESAGIKLIKIKPKDIGLNDLSRMLEEALDGCR